MRPKPTDTRHSQSNLVQWCQRYANDKRVVRWIDKHPAPSYWAAPTLAYAYLEMPDFNTIWGRVLIWFGV